MAKELTDSLFNQLAKLSDTRLSGDLGVVHDIETYFRQVEPSAIIRTQIKAILEYVPSVFPENWQVQDYSELSPEQEQAYKRIADMGIQPCSTKAIQKIINLGVAYKEKYSK